MTKSEEDDDTALLTDSKLQFVSIGTSISTLRCDFIEKSQASKPTTACHAPQEIEMESDYADYILSVMSI